MIIFLPQKRSVNLDQKYILNLKDTNLNIYIFVVVILDEAVIVVTVHFSMNNMKESCDLSRELW